MKLLTICTAVYNAEKYLVKMIESIVNSKCIDNIEFILVNDGSTDSSIKIINDFQKKYPQSIVVIDKKNGGSGAARNEAFKIASGKYIKLIDADDWVDTDKFDEYLGILKEIDSDIIINPFFIYQEQKGTKSLNNYPSLNIWGEKINIDDFQIDERLAMHGVTYRTEIIKNNGIRLSEGVSYVDVEYLALPVEYLHSVYCINIPFYVYRTGISGQSVDPEINFKKHNQKVEIFNRINDEVGFGSLTDGQRRFIINALKTIAISMIIDRFYPKGMKYKKAIAETDYMISQKNRDVYDAMNDDFVVRLLRRTNYLAYYPLTIGRTIKHIMTGEN